MDAIKDDSCKFGDLTLPHKKIDNPGIHIVFLVSILKYLEQVLKLPPNELFSLPSTIIT